MSISSILESIFGIIVISAVAAETGITVENGPEFMAQAITITRTYVVAIFQAMGHP